MEVVQGVADNSSLAGPQNSASADSIPDGSGKRNLFASKKEVPDRGKYATLMAQSTSSSRGDFKSLSPLSHASHEMSPETDNARNAGSTAFRNSIPNSSENSNPQSREKLADSTPSSSPSPLVLAPLKQKRAPALLRSVGLHTASHRLLRSGSIGSIDYSGTNVNISGVPFSSLYGVITSAYGRK